MTQPQIPIAMVGLSGRGQYWLRLLLEHGGFRVVALCDATPALVDEALKLLPDPAGVKTYTRYEDVLADSRVEAVGLAVRSLRQGALAAQALEAGKHVNCEVPAAHSIEDCWRIVLAAERSGKVFHLGEQTRYWGFIEAWKRLIADGALGQVVYAEGQYFHPLIQEHGLGYLFRDRVTGRKLTPEQAANNPNAEKAVLHQHPPIHYLPHELSPLLKAMDDRVVQVVGMGIDAPSRVHPAVELSDLQIGLMKTAKGAMMRLGVTFTVPMPARPAHWYQVIGTRGAVETGRSSTDKARLWLADAQMYDMAEVDWRTDRTDAPAGAIGSGHGGADWYVHDHFHRAVTQGKPPEMSVYDAMDTAAPAILAADSIDQGSRPLAVPDFRPSALRPAGTAPKG